ncbi:MAG: PIN domain-containing protein [Cypionkella sp.]|uniref:RSP_2648 family PIN domain-containing protein n=1 Tax=Cypionkella sp. TaxID=2811411 RepID=UPI002ABAFD32|nr:PIN domain-containing protein [Cypionkella sp.]MDZ4312891.1 PIN domain-containing protein [Cypionkella sp.]MDZ4392581.1 PIN domain-containing protein [Cypionkella sp.]
MKAVLDACVIYPTVLREILLGVAAKGLYEPLWSDRILREWTRAVAKLGPVAQAQAETEAILLRTAFPRGFVREQPSIESRLLLPDPNDVHVLAVAIAGHADCIVTFNAQDFPRHLLAEEGLERRDPDGLLWQLWSFHPAEVAEVIAHVHATAETMLGTPIPLKSLLKRAKLPRLAKALLA